MAELRKNIVKVGKMITDDMRIATGQVKLDEMRPEYWMLDLLLNDEQAKMAL